MKTAAVFLTGVVLGALVTGPDPATARASATSADAGHLVVQEPGALVVQNVYYPRPGMEDQVLTTRLEASAVRNRLGLGAGRVLRRVDGPEDGPYVMWEAEYASQAAREEEVAALEGTDFERVAAHMGTLLDGFERTVWEAVDER